MDEFGLIEKYLAPLATDPGAFSLKNDAAVFSVKDGNELVVTKDAICEGVHFFSGTDPVKIAKKLIRVNLSDMAAMGAEPRCYLVAAALSKDTTEDWIRDFCIGLNQDQEEFGISLLGGDTVKHDGPITLSMTMLGEVKKGSSIERSNAQVGDDIWVTGTIGDSALGLYCLQSNLNFHKLVNRYEIPEPRVNFGAKLVNIANCAVDISDGLLADLDHICEQSGVGAEIQKDAIPLSEESSQLIEKEEDLLDRVFCGGDDYELLFTANNGLEGQIYELSMKTDAKVTKIGKITEKSGVKVVDTGGEEIKFKKYGYKHL